MVSHQSSQQETCRQCGDPVDDPRIAREVYGAILCSDECFNEGWDESMEVGYAEDPLGGAW